MTTRLNDFFIVKTLNFYIKGVVHRKNLFLSLIRNTFGVLKNPKSAKHEKV